ncbi:MAG: response regulator [Campylobacterales bacterium]|nr:response regulator [Campylobacterales bacterium]
MSDRILVVEDNKALAKLMAKKIQTELDIEVDVAYKLSEAKLFLKKYNYFLTLLDLNLPDAPNGEVVDYALEDGNKVIVLSGNIDKEFRKKILQKNIIDYVNKSGINDINYIIHKIERLQKNRNHTVLVVDDSMIFRKQIQNMLQNLFYNVITVAHGEEAMGMLEVKPEITLVITDYNMPVMDGLQLTQEIRKTYSKSDMGIIALSSNNEDEINALFLKQGANDYITKPFSKEEFSCRIDNTIESLENIQIITNHANRDYLTGLYSRLYLINHVKEYAAEIQESDEKCAFVMVTIDFFQKLKSTYGSEFADKMITHVANILVSNTSYIDLIAKYGVEDFCIILKNTTHESTLNILHRLKEKVQEAPLKIDNENVINLTISIGAAMNQDEVLEDALDNADMMLYKAKEAGIDQLFFE